MKTKELIALLKKPKISLFEEEIKKGLILVIKYGYDELDDTQIEIFTEMFCERVLLAVASEMGICIQYPKEGRSGSIDVPIESFEKFAYAVALVDFILCMHYDEPLLFEPFPEKPPPFYVCRSYSVHKRMCSVHVYGAARKIQGIFYQDFVVSTMGYL